MGLLGFTLKGTAAVVGATAKLAAKGLAAGVKGGINLAGAIKDKNDAKKMVVDMYNDMSTNHWAIKISGASTVIQSRFIDGKDYTYSEEEKCKIAMLPYVFKLDNECLIINGVNCGDISEKWPIPINIIDAISAHDFSDGDPFVVMPTFPNHDDLLQNFKDGDDPLFDDFCNRLSLFWDNIKTMCPELIRTYCEDEEKMELLVDKNFVEYMNTDLNRTKKKNEIICNREFLGKATPVELHLYDLVNEFTQYR